MKRSGKSPVSQELPLNSRWTPLDPKTARLIIEDFLSWHPNDRRAFLARWDAETLNRFAPYLDPLDVAVVKLERRAKERERRDAERKKATSKVAGWLAWLAQSGLVEDDE